MRPKASGPPGPRRSRPSFRAGRKFRISTWMAVAGAFMGALALYLLLVEVFGVSVELHPLGKR